jgi:hypothetical protein
LNRDRSRIDATHEFVVPQLGNRVLIDTDSHVSGDDLTTENLDDPPEPDRVQFAIDVKPSPVDPQLMAGPNGLTWTFEVNLVGQDQPITAKGFALRWIRGNRLRTGEIGDVCGRERLGVDRPTLALCVGLDPD